MKKHKHVPECILMTKITKATVYLGDLKLGSRPYFNNFLNTTAVSFCKLM